MHIPFLETIFSMFDGFLAYIGTISVGSLFATYWFLFFIELPRYYLADIIVVGYRYLIRDKILRRNNAAKAKFLIDRPLISIIVPGKNEGQHIYKLVMSLKEQTYNNFELIIIDDGSDDTTPLICRNLEKLGYIDTYLRFNVRGGKASAANYGLYTAKGKYIVHLDADSSLDRDALEKIIIPFYLDQKIKGVGGCVKVRNMKDNLCTSLQALEYLKTIMVGRTVSSTLGIYRVISGAFGAFEAKTLRRIGGWDIGPGLDGDVTQKIRNLGCKVYFEHSSICLTNVPTSWFTLFRQRLRWSKSLVRFRMRKHAGVLIPNRHFSVLNFISSVENILFESVFNFVWLFYIINIFLDYKNDLLEIFLVGYFIRVCFAVVAFVVIMLFSERSKDERFLWRYLPLSSLYTGYFLRFARLLAHIMELFFFSSYKDPWNPRKTSIWAQTERG